MTETAPVPETPTNVKLEPTSSENDPNAANAQPGVVTEGPAEPVPLVAVKTEAAAAGAAEVKKEEPAVAVKTEAAVKTEEPAAGDLAKIKQLLEFYFGDANYRRDKFLQNEAAKDPEGFIKITTLLTFNKLKAITTDPAVVARAMDGPSDAAKGALIVLNADKTGMKRAVPLPEIADAHLRTLFVEGIPRQPMEGHNEATVDDVVALFQPYGQVAFVRLGRDKVTKRITGTAFVEFANVEGLNKALEGGWADKTVVLAGKPIKLKVRKYEKDHKAQVALARAKAEAEGVSVGQKRKAEDNGPESPTNNKVYDFDVPENFEKELKTLIPRHVKFEGVPPGATFHELRDFFAQHGHVKYVSHNPAEGGVALIKFLVPASAAKFYGESPEVKEVEFKGRKLTVSAPTEDEVREQLKAKNARKRAKLEGRTQHFHRGGGRGGGGGRGRGGGRGHKRGRF